MPRSARISVQERDINSRSRHNNGGNGRKYWGGEFTDQAYTVVTVSAMATSKTLPMAGPTPCKPSATTATFDAATTESSRLAGIDFSFPEGSPINDTPVKFSMTSDCGASSHFIDNHIFPGTKRRIVDYVKLDWPATIVVAGDNQLHRIGKGTVLVLATDHQGNIRSVRLPGMIVRGLERPLFSGGTAALQGVTTFISKQAYLDLGGFRIPLQEYAVC